MRSACPFPEAPDRRVVDPPCGRRPIPPVDHGPGTEVHPVAAVAGNEEHAVAGDLEAQQWWGRVEVDEVDLTPGRAPQVRLEPRPQVRCVGIQENPDIDIAAGALAAAGYGAESGGEANGGCGHQSCPELLQQVHRTMLAARRGDPRGALRSRAPAQLARSAAGKPARSGRCRSRSPVAAKMALATAGAAGGPAVSPLPVGARGLGTMWPPTRGAPLRRRRREAWEVVFSAGAPRAAGVARPAAVA